MTFFLDTDICIFALRGTHPALIEEFQSRKPDAIKIPSIVAAELWLGAYKSSNSSTAQKAVEAFLEPFEIISFDDKGAEAYAALRADLEEKGKPIGPNDLVIAATVLAHRGVLVTHNLKEFSQVPGLRTQDWLASGSGKK